MAGYFSSPSQMPGALIEPLFITDPFEGSIAASVTGQHAIAAGLDHAVDQYFAPPARRVRRAPHERLPTPWGGRHRHRGSSGQACVSCWSKTTTGSPSLWRRA